LGKILLSVFAKSFRNEEILRTQKILQHSAFLSNPLAIIKQHVVNSINLKETQEAQKKEAEKAKPKKKGFGDMQLEWN